MDLKEKKIFNNLIKVYVALFALVIIYGYFKCDWIPFLLYAFISIPTWCLVGVIHLMENEQ